MSETTENKPSKQNLYQEKPGGFFKKGNPGRPKGAKNFTTKVREALEKVSEDKSSTYEELLIKTIVNKSIGGSDNIIKLIWEQLDGKPLQKTILANDGEEAFKIDHNNADLKEITTKYEEEIRRRIIES
jgi:glucose-6-phosphate isomerase